MTPGRSKDGGLPEDLFGKRVTLMGIRAYAKHRAARKLPGSWPNAVATAIAAGRIPSCTIAGEVYIDPAAADRAWAENTLPAISRSAGPEVSPAEDKPSGSGNGDGQSYAGTRGRLAEVELEIRKLKLEALRGNLVSANKVRREAFEVGRSVRERIMSIPPRLAALVVAKAASGNVHAVEQLLAMELHGALKELAGGETDE